MRKEYEVLAIKVQMEHARELADTVAEVQTMAQDLATEIRLALHSMTAFGGPDKMAQVIGWGPLNTLIALEDVLNLIEDSGLED